MTETKTKPQRLAGFTLVELLVIMAIMALLTTLMLANFREGEKQKRVALAVDGITNIARLTQNYSLSGRQIPGNLTPVSGTRCTEDFSAEVYRMSFGTSLTQMNVIAVDKCGAVFNIETFNLPGSTRIQANGLSLRVCNPSCTTSTPSSVNINLTPPFGTMSASPTGSGGVYNPFAYLDITVEHTDGTRNKTLRIDGVSGRIGG